MYVDAVFLNFNIFPLQPFVVLRSFYCSMVLSAKINYPVTAIR